VRLGVHAGGAGEKLPLRLAWLTALRLLVLTAFLVVTTTLYLGGFTLGGFSSTFALVTVAAAYFLAGLYAILLRVGRGLVPVAYAQLVTDQIAWTAIAYISGGATSGATSLYGLTCLSGAILLGARGGVTAALSASVCFTALCAAFAGHLLHPPTDQPPEAYVTRWSDLGYSIFIVLVALAVVTALSSYLAERLRTTGGHLEQATARAEQAERLALLGSVAAGLAHEIRNPLGSISGSIELLRTGGTLSDEDKRLCELVERETARLNDLVSDMLDLSKPRPPTPAPMDLAATARDVVVLAAKSGRGGDVSVHYEGLDAAPIVADAAQMRQALWNLVRNAIQVSTAGAEVVVRVADAANDRGLELEVKDHGPGISAEARDKLFDAFFTTRAHGMGIGLAVVKRICDEHRFAIGAESSEGAGTIFRVVIPESARNVAPALATSATPGEQEIAVASPGRALTSGR
jgi:signal transduction histidine kinase